ncbi:MAG TPA: protein translocase subunit SecD [Candidatus Paceibacterota bacterium]|jgi:protein-export membrane protein SecD|nr:protein translocase subunit SecD [Parcubacteria group bacterium]HJN62848.1 protein translocase subunit SecD [Candidatus Paceibacterota bacterium]|tara:strand:+ start:1159 stop:2466 length:1308 start_codon:yes stop_codon:yes gene_type:complete
MTALRITAILILIIGVFIGYLALTKDSFKLGLDLSGGTHLAYKADTSEVGRTEVKDLMNALRDVIERRVNLFGVGEPVVQVEEGGLFGNVNDQRLIVELPGVTDVEEAINLIGKTPLLEFRLVKDGESLLAQDPEASVEDILIPTGLTGRMVKRATLQFGQDGLGRTGSALNSPSIGLEFNKDGAELFQKITGENVGEPLAIILDGEVISAPNINTEISGGNAVITGQFTPEEAKELVRDLNFGALPLAIELISTQSIGPSLGAQTVEAGIKAGIWGIILVALFLLLWYRASGLVAILSLSIYIVLMLAIFKLIPVTLTAAGIAGFILSIGMAVDANILIFERMKEELEEGTPSMEEAVRNGFSRAWLSIRDSNISSIITAIILFWFGTSLVKGFALTFGLGVIVSMITAISISRTFLLAVVPERFNRMFGVGFK